MVRELDDLLEVLYFLAVIEKTVPFAQNFHLHFVVQSCAIIAPPPTAFVLDQAMRWQVWSRGAPSRDKIFHLFRKTFRVK